MFNKLADYVELTVHLRWQSWRCCRQWSWLPAFSVVSNAKDVCMSSLLTSLVAQQSNTGAGGAMFILLIEIAIIIVVVIGLWKVFEKAGQPGWAAIVPIYNIVVLLQIAGKPIWWIILFFIPLVNLIPAIMVPIAIAEKFGKSVAFGVGLIFLPF